MKASQFNISYRYEDYYILFNTKTREIVRFPLKQQGLVDMLLRNEGEQYRDDIKIMLSKKGFMVPAQIDELEELRSQCYNLVNSKILYLTIMPTYTCNLSCIYCFQHHIQGAIIDDSTVEKIIKAVEKNIDGHEALYVEWFGGEPLVASKQVLHMNQRFNEICHTAKIPYAARITTNGYNLSLDIFCELQKNNCFVYYISVDGDQKLHDRQRPCKNGAGSYEVIMNNLKKIKWNVASNNFRIEIRVNCSRESYDCLETFLADFERDLGNDRRFSLVIETVNDWSDRTEKMNEEGKLLEQSDLGELAKIARRYNINLASTDRHLLNTQICQAAKRNAYSIFYDGTIRKCQMAQESKEYCQMDVIGEITNNGDFMIDEAKEAFWVSDVFPQSCTSCKLLPLCLGKKCVFSIKIKNEICQDIEDKFLNYFISYDASKIENIELCKL